MVPLKQFSPRLLSSPTRQLLHQTIHRSKSLAASANMPEYLDLPVLPADIAFGLVADYEADQHPQKVSLVAGAYRDAKGLPWILPSVKEAKERIAADPSFNHEYLGIAGSPTYLELAKSLVFGPELAQRRKIASIQTVSGTGANHLGALFLAQTLKPSQVFIPDPTWLNHKTIWTQAGPHVVQKEYPYYSAATRAIDFDGMLSTLETQAKPCDVVILQACAHNPTGLDLSRDQWRQVAGVVARKKLFALFDSAYQGFATGDVEADVWSVRYFAEKLFAGQDQGDHPGLCVAQSFSKNFGLYGERVGALHLVTPGDASLQGAKSHLSLMARAEYSNPPRFGSRIVETVLGDEGLRAQWQRDLDTMSARIRGMRGQLRQKLEALNTPGDWSHMEEQIGMFSYTGLKKEQVERLKNEYHVYLLPSGRASLCGLNESNVEYVARAISDVVRESK